MSLAVSNFKGWVSGTHSFETEQAQRIALALKPAIEAGHLIALTGITGCGKTTTTRRIRQDLDKERKILVATNLAVDKERVKLGTLMEAIYADIGTDKEAMLAHAGRDTGAAVAGPDPAPGQARGALHR